MQTLWIELLQKKNNLCDFFWKKLFSASNLRSNSKDQKMKHIMLIFINTKKEKIMQIFNAFLI